MVEMRGKSVSKNQREEACMDERKGLGHRKESDGNMTGYSRWYYLGQGE